MLFVHVSGGLRVWMGVGCPCPPVRNDIVTPRNLFFSYSFSYSCSCYFSVFAPPLFSLFLLFTLSLLLNFSLFHTYPHVHFAVFLPGDGKLDVVYNGIPDWVYEEEVLASDNAIWWSPDRKFLCYMRFDDTQVHRYTNID